MEKQRSGAAYGKPVDTPGYKGPERRRAIRMGKLQWDSELPTGIVDVRLVNPQKPQR